MDTVLQKISDVTIVTLVAKRLDARNSKDFKLQIASLAKESSKVIINMGELESVDSSGLGALLCFSREVSQRGGELKLCRLKKPVRTLFELVRMHKIFEIFNTEEEALRSYRN